MKFLSIDSSSRAASVALISDGNILGEFFVNNKLTHSQTLMKMTENLLSVTETKMSDITAIVVTDGPGSFTGIRIGIAAVKGLALGADKLCIPVSSLEAVAYNFLGEKCIISVNLDARQNQVYNAIFSAEGDRIERLTEDRAISAEALKEELKQYDNVLLCGDGAYVVKAVCPEYRLAPEGKMYQKASSAAFAANKSLEKGVSPQSLVPKYLRLSQAERLRKKEEL